MQEKEVKGKVRQFYDHVGWQAGEDGLYQNASYEDLRSVSQEYIHKCHLRVNRHLAQQGKYLLDAGSGPVQYSEYETYSAGYSKRVCMDLSFVALKEARKRLGEKGFYVVSDISKLPFKSEVFDGIVSLHTIHHIPLDEKVQTYKDLLACLKPGKTMVTVDGWGYSPLMAKSERLLSITTRLLTRKTVKDQHKQNKENRSQKQEELKEGVRALNQSRAGTFVEKLDAKWFKRTMTGQLSFKILVWRSVSTRFLRTMIQPEWAGRFWLKILYCLEEIFPRFLGENGSYPMIVMEKPGTDKVSQI
ncbi:MAG: class I SAM-dependent methyltransferase [Anaerolineaceae bacterium]|nr:class I SAM-dependent methyltransferase [Anaerolineaceae bacterium]